MKKISSPLLVAAAVLALACPATLLAQSSCILAGEWAPRDFPRHPTIPIHKPLPSPRPEPITHKTFADRVPGN